MRERGRRRGQARSSNASIPPCIGVLLSPLLTSITHGFSPPPPPPDTDRGRCPPTGRGRWWCGGARTGGTTADAATPQEPGSARRRRGDGPASASTRRGAATTLPRLMPGSPPAQPSAPISSDELPLATKMGCSAGGRRRLAPAGGAAADMCRQKGTGRSGTRLTRPSLLTRGAGTAVPAQRLYYLGAGKSASGAATVRHRRESVCGQVTE